MVVWQDQNIIIWTWWETAIEGLPLTAVPICILHLVTGHHTRYYSISCKDPVFWQKIHPYRSPYLPTNPDKRKLPLEAYGWLSESKLSYASLDMLQFLAAAFDKVLRSWPSCFTLLVHELLFSDTFPTSRWERTVHYQLRRGVCSPPSERDGHLGYWLLTLNGANADYTEKNPAVNFHFENEKSLSHERARPPHGDRHCLRLWAWGQKGFRISGHSGDSCLALRYSYVHTPNFIIIVFISNCSHRSPRQHPWTPVCCVIRQAYSGLSSLRVRILQIEDGRDTTGRNVL